jgi:hypothetical protein
MIARSILSLVVIVPGMMAVALSGLGFSTFKRPDANLGFRIESREFTVAQPLIGVFAIVGGITLLLRRPESD